MAVRPVGDVLDELNAALNGGDLLRAYDIACEGLKDHPDSEALKHKGALALARAGATERAARLFDEHGLGGSTNGDVLALWGRLEKDRALRQSGEARRLGLLRAAEAYREASLRTEDYYPTINRASCLFLGGDAEAAKAAATAVLAHPKLQDGGDYYDLATHAEAEIVLGGLDSAAAALGLAARAEADPGSRSTTRRQFRLLLKAQDVPAETIEALLAPLAPKPTLHYSCAPVGGPGLADPARLEQLASRLAGAVAELSPGAGFGSLANPAEILTAEALLSAGAELNIVLPFATDAFADKMARPAGENWLARFRQCLERAARVSHATEGASIEDASLFGYAGRIAMGLAILRAQYLDGEAVQLALWDGRESAGPDGVYADMKAWSGSGQSRQTVLRLDAERTTSNAERPVPAPRPFGAVVFGDFPGFSKMPEDLLPSFWTDVMGAIGAALSDRRDAVPLADTWGDAIHLVVADVRRAAELCLDIQARLARIDGDRFGRDGPLVMRIGAHYAPIYKGWNPISQETTYFGRALSQAARIEPIAPAGRVYVTEAFAAMIKLEADEDYECTYVGKVPLAKGFGAFRMYDLAKRVSL